MFRCDQCHTEYGGIRGISIDRCPRCRQQAGAAETRPTVAAAWGSSESPGSNWSPLPLLGPIAQLDQAIRV